MVRALFVTVMKKILLKFYLISYLVFTLLLIPKLLFSEPKNKEFIISSYIGGVSLAKGKISLHFKDNKYDLKVYANSVGIFSLFLDWSQKLNSSGMIKKNSFYSSNYFSKDQRGKKVGYIEIDFSKSPPLIISAQPDPREDTRREILKSFLKNVNDPVAGVFNLASNRCNKVIEIYDGKRRYNLKINSKKISSVNHSFLGVDEIKTYKCNFEINRLAGYTKKELEKFNTEYSISLQS